MNKFLFGLLVAAGLSFFGCAKSVEKAQHDVRTARDNATQDVRHEQDKLQDTKRDAAERIARQERRVEDAARQGNAEITKEQRELEDAKQAEARHETNDASLPRTSDRSATVPSKQPAHIDVNVNRGAGGVTVDVNRNP